MLLICLRQHVFPLLYRLHYCLYKVRHFDMGEICSGIAFTLRFAKQVTLYKHCQEEHMDVHNVDITYLKLGGKELDYKPLCV
jgi:hypothetical protein